MKWLIEYSNIFDTLLEGAPLEEAELEGTFDDVISEIAKKEHKYKFARLSVKVEEKRKRLLGLKEDFEYFETVMILKTKFARHVRDALRRQKGGDEDGRGSG